jgi:hypothetical protein
MTWNPLSRAPSTMSSTPMTAALLSAATTTPWQWPPRAPAGDLAPAGTRSNRPAARKRAIQSRRPSGPRLDRVGAPAAPGRRRRCRRLVMPGSRGSHALEAASRAEHKDADRNEPRVPQDQARVCLRRPDRPLCRLPRSAIRARAAPAGKQDSGSQPPGGRHRASSIYAAANAPSRRRAPPRPPAAGLYPTARAGRTTRAFGAARSYPAEDARPALPPTAQ